MRSHKTPLFAQLQPLKRFPFRCPCAQGIWWLGLLMVAMTIIVYWPAWHYGFVAWDDNLHVYANPRFHPVTWSNLAAFWSAPYAGLYMPLTYTVWATLMWLTHLLTPWTSPAGLFHFGNLLLHLGSVLVVYRIGLLVFGQEKIATLPIVGAAVGALLFGLHPLQVEAVTWVSGLKDVLCGWWALVAVWQYLLFVRTAQERRRQWGHYGLATAAFGLALLAKPAAVVVPGIAGVLALAGCKQRWQQIVKLLGSWFLVAVLWGVWTKGQQPDAVLEYVTPWWGRFIVAADAMLFYLGKLVWPRALGPDYGRTPQAVLTQSRWLVVSLMPVGFAMIGWWGRRYWRILGLTVGVFVAGILPVLGLVPFMFQAYSTVADRYVYLAMLGPALGLAWLFQRLERLQVIGVIGTVVLLGLLGWRSIAQVRLWQDTATLLTHALQINPHSTLAHNNLGWVFLQQGQLDAAIRHYTEAVNYNPHSTQFHTNLGSALAAQGRLDEAMMHYTNALGLNPRAPQAYYNLGNLFARQGKHDAAIEHYSTALRLNPAWAEVHINLGSVLDDQGRTAEAIVHYQAALRLQPQSAAAHNNLGDAWLKQGRTVEAITEFSAAVRLKPTWAEAYYNLGLAFVRFDRWQEAVSAYRTALHWRPAWPQAARNLAGLLVLQSPLTEQTAAEAIHLAEQACQATDYQDATALYTLAVVYQAAGREAQAQDTAQHTLRVATATGNATLAAQLKARFAISLLKDVSDDLP